MYTLTGYEGLAAKYIKAFMIHYNDSLGKSLHIFILTSMIYFAFHKDRAIKQFSQIFIAPNSFFIYQEIRLN